MNSICTDIEIMIYYQLLLLYIKVNTERLILK